MNVCVPTYIRTGVSCCCITSTMEVPPISFLHMGLEYCNSTSTNTCRNIQRFKSLFGPTPLVCSKIWSQLSLSLISKPQPKHLLYALSFRKLYGTDTVFHMIFGTDEKTCRYWSRYFIEKISVINNVSYQYHIIRKKCRFLKI